MFCAKCGKEMDDNAKYCPSCGADTTVQPVSSGQPVPSEQPSYQQASYSEPAYTEQTAPSGAGVGAMVCGIISLVLFWVPIVGLVLGIIATILGGKGRQTLPPDKRGMSLAGFIMGIIGMAIGIIILVVLIIAVVAFGSAVSILGSMY